MSCVQFEMRKGMVCSPGRCWERFTEEVTFKRSLPGAEEFTREGGREKGLVGVATSACHLAWQAAVI